MSALRAALCVFPRYIVTFCVLHCYMFYAFFCNYLFSFLMVLLQGISAGGSFTVVPVIVQAQAGPEDGAIGRVPPGSGGEAFCTKCPAKFPEVMSVSAWLLGEFLVLRSLGMRQDAEWVASEQMRGFSQRCFILSEHRFCS